MQSKLMRCSNYSLSRHLGGPLKAPGNYTAMKRTRTECTMCTGSTGNAEITLHAAISLHLTS